MSTTVTTKGQVTIPKAVRERLGIVPGSQVDFVLTPNGNVLPKHDAPPGMSRFARIVGSAGPGMTTDELMALLAVAGIGLRAMTRQALFLAGKACERYRRGGGPRATLPPDLFTGAQAAAERLYLLTPDPRRRRTYFPSVELITPPVISRAFRK
jgi:antitoxin PrlF